MLGEDESVARLATIRRLVGAGDLAGLDRILYCLCPEIDGNWDFDGGRLIAPLRGELPIVSRVRLLRLMTDGLEESAVHQPQQCAGLARLIVLLAEGLSAEESAAWRDPLVELAAGRMALWEGWRLTCLVQVEQAAGRALPGAVVATVRRTALTSETPGELGTLAATLVEPVLNPGEGWAEKAMADLKGVEAEWQPLIAHALSSSGSRPTARWQRVGRTLLTELGPERARAAITSWLALAGEPRTSPAEAAYGIGSADLELDPFNTKALRGLAGLLALAPVHPDSAEVLGRLVQQALVRIRGIGPRSPKTASAAAHALAQLGDGSAFAQLSRLAVELKYRPTQRIVAAALASWAS